MAEALDIATERARQVGAERIARIEMRVGGLSGVVREAMAFAFEALTPGTLAEGAVLDLQLVPVTAHCHACDVDFEPDSVFYECPQCGEISGDIRGGGDIEVVSVEV